MRTTKEPVKPRTVSEIRKMVLELEVKRQDLQSGSIEKTKEARKLDFQNADPATKLALAQGAVGQKEQAAEQAFYEELARLSALLAALKWALGIVPVIK